MLSHCPGGLWVFEENVWANVEDCKRGVGKSKGFSRD